MLVGLPSPFVGFRRWKALLNTVAAARFPFLDEALDDTVAAFILYCPNFIRLIHGVKGCRAVATWEGRWKHFSTVFWQIGQGQLQEWTEHSHTDL